MKILFPTDFSDHADVALEYAIRLSNELMAELHIITAYSVTTSAGSIGSMDAVLQQTNESDMSKLVSGILPLIKTDVLPVSGVFKGIASNIIAWYAHQHEIDLIVMGTRGSSGISSVFLGSTTRKVIDKSKVPVLAIPKNLNEKVDHSKILLTVDDNKFSSEKQFSFLKKLALTKGARIDIIHIMEINKETSVDQKIVDYFSEIPGDIIAFEDEDPVKAIKEYADLNFTGIIVMIKRPHGFFSKLFVKGNLEAELAQTEIPLMSLPDIN